MKKFKQLINEISVLGSFKSGLSSGGIFQGIQQGVKSFNTNVKNRGVLGAILPGSYIGAKETAYDTAASFVQNPNRGGMTPREKMAVKTSNLQPIDVNNKSASDLRSHARRYGNIGMSDNLRDKTYIQRLAGGGIHSARRAARSF